MKPTRPTQPNARRFGISRRRLLLTLASGALILSVRGEAQSMATESPQSAEGDDAPSAKPNAKPDDLSASSVSSATVAHAQKLAGIELDPQHHALIAATAGVQLQRFEKRRTQTLANGLAPATVLDPALTAARASSGTSRSTSSFIDEVPLPSRDADIAFAPVARLAGWIRSGKITSRRLTEIYLERLARYGDRLECVTTVVREQALAEAEAADAEIAAGHYRGPLHGIPYGAKDLFDTKGVLTTWGATPYKARVPQSDATVVAKLRSAGAVLLAKTTLGALAYGDIWYGGKTRNPWNPRRGSSGSSAGSAAATAAGLVGFSLGTETYGSIVSPCMQCGTTGLRPTFGRVSRAGAMALCWSLDKVGPITRTVTDSELVLAAISGQDDGDTTTSAASHYLPTESRDLSTLRVGFDPRWFAGKRAHPLDREVLEFVRSSGAQLGEITFPDLPYESLLTILEVEAASAFDELTRSGGDAQLRWQDPEAWPNTFRRTRFVPAVEFVQAQRWRRTVSETVAKVWGEYDVLLSPSFHSPLLLVTNFTGHPCLTIRTGFRFNGQQPHGMTLWGALGAESALCELGRKIEGQREVWHRRPPAFL